MPADPLPPGGRLALEEAGDALVVRIANETRANALDEALLDGLVSLLNGPRPAEFRAVLLAGAGDRHFSAGLDLGDRPPEELSAYLEDGARRMQEAARAIAGCAVPVVGVINGAAFGGALELAMACDWRIARRGARLGMPAARLGVVYAPRGPAALRGGPRPGTHAAPVPDGRARGRGRGPRDRPGGPGGGAGRAVARGPRRRRRRGGRRPLAVAGTRAIVRALSEGPLAPEVDRAAGEWVARAFASDDFREGLAAFRERRPPDFRGR